MMRLATALALGVALMGTAPAARAEVADEIEFLRREVYHLRREIAELKALLTRALTAQGVRPTPSKEPTRVTVPVAGQPSLGRPDAPLTLVEFSSYQCPYCKQYVETVLPKLKTAYIDTGKVRYVFRDFPLAREPDASRAAKAAHCAGEQGRYWEMHDEVFKHQEDLSVDALKRRAQALGLDLSKFGSCLDSERLAGVVEKGVADARAAGFRGTPSFVLGPTADGDKVTGLPIIGAQSFAAFQQVIEHELERLAGQGQSGGKGEPQR